MAVIAMFISFVYHGSLLLFGTYRRTYDAYVHIFFADHYARFWWDPWDVRWYTGFTLTSYPPASHQLTALLSKVMGLELGFATVFLFGVTALTLGIYRFSLLWLDKEAAGVAAPLHLFLLNCHHHSCVWSASHHFILEHVDQRAAFCLQMG